jgi:hypothetical protein
MLDNKENYGLKITGLMEVLQTLGLVFQVDVMFVNGGLFYHKNTTRV